MPLELYTGARLAVYPEQTHCLPHLEMQLRSQTQRTPSKDRSTIKLGEPLAPGAVTPASAGAGTGCPGGQAAPQQQASTSVMLCSLRGGAEQHCQHGEQLLQSQTASERRERCSTIRRY